MKRLTDRQSSILKRTLRDGHACISPDVGRQLERKGLIVRLGDFERVEWGRVVARLCRVMLTPEGERTAKEL